jgi:hypothetical protein
MDAPHPTLTNNDQLNDQLFATRDRRAERTYRSLGVEYQFVD